MLMNMNVVAMEVIGRENNPAVNDVERYMAKCDVTREGWIQGSSGILMETRRKKIY